MVEIKDIKDRESLKAWLEEQDSYEITVTIAHRAAMRVIPVEWCRLILHLEKDGLPIHMSLKELLISGVAARGSEPDIEEAATDTAISNYFATFRAGHAAARAASLSSVSCIFSPAKISASLTTATRAAADACSTAYNAAATAADFDLWNWTRRDCAALMAGQDISTTGLWFGDENPLEDEWQRLKRALTIQKTNEASAREGTNIDWSFWIDWYQLALDGTEDRWDMLTEIALLDPKIWEGEPDELMDQIYAIQAKYARDATAYAEVVSFNPETEKWRSDPITQLPDARAQDFQDKIFDALALFPPDDTANAQYAGIRGDLGRLKTQTERYVERGQPVLLYDAASAAVKMLDRRAEVGDCPKATQDPIIGQFRDEVLDAANDLRVFDPEVAHVVETRALDKADKAAPEDRKLLAEAAKELEPISEGNLAEGFRDDAALILDPMASPYEGRQAIYRISGRILRVATKTYAVPRKLLKETAEVSKDVAAVVKNSASVAAAYKVILWLFG